MRVIPKSWPIGFLALSINAALFSLPASAQQDNDTLVVSSASKQSQYAASSQNVASYSVSSSQLEDANITNTQDLNKVLPGVNIGKASGFTFPQSSIRGIASLDFYNPALTLYVDGIPQSSMAFMQAMGDVKSVEMLKGAQSTLYGKAAQGGIVDVITEQPDGDYKGYLSGGYASRNGYKGKINVSGPIAQGILYGSLTGLRQTEPGRLKNPGTGSKHVNGQQDNLGAIKLRLAPDNQPWEINAAYNAQCTDSSESVYVPFNNITSADIVAVSPDPKLHRCINNQTLRAQYNTGHWLLSAVSSWQQINLRTDISYPGFVGVNTDTNRWLVDVQEIRAATQGKGNLVDGVIGLYRENTRQFTDVPSVNKRESLAAYTDLTWHVTTDFSAGAGLRFSHDKASIKLIQNDSIIGNESNNNNLLGQLSAGYQLTKENRVYARIAQGYQTGGYDYSRNIMLSASAYQPQKNITYEIGNKYSTDNVNVQGAVFYTSTKDFQMYRGRISQQTLQNAGDARAFGLELNADYVFIPGWRLAANLNFTNSKFTDNPKNERWKNKRMPFVPEYSGAIYLTGNVNTVIGTLIPYVGFNATGSYDFVELDIPKGTKQSAYTTTDIRLSWKATDRIIISAYIDNLFDKRFASYVYNYDPVFAAVNNGRTAGVDLKIDLF